MDQPPAGGKDAYTRDTMQQIAHQVDELIPQGWGFFVMVFPMGGAEGRSNYVSNANREDVRRLMQEFIAKGGFQPGHQ